MKSKTFVAVIAVAGIAAGGLLMWTGDASQSSSPKRVASVSSAGSQINRSQVNRDADKRVPEAEAVPSDLAAQVSATTQSLGPMSNCVEITKAVMCPFFGNIPFVREVTGQIAAWGQISCPAG